MASDLNYFKLCSIVLFSAILCASAAVLSDNHENNSILGTGGIPTCLLKQFRCDNQRCIQSKWMCDGEDDCGDNSDEKYSICHVNRNCTETEFKCHSGRCITKEWVCDKENDCDDNSDEDSDMCDVLEKCDDGQFQCSDGACIPDHWKCDGKNDCPDSSDEKGCHITCSPDQFACGDGFCIENKFVCDGEEDCNDGRDEKNCKKPTCGPKDILCPKENRCIPSKWACDGHRDCEDGTDELGCVYEERAKICANTEWPCADRSSCVHTSWLCDGDSDCSDSSDESPALCSNLTCRADQFQCKNRQCIPGYKHCDNENDCLDSSDEEDCENHRKQCASDEFDCGENMCIPVSKVCNGVAECPGHEDEPPNMCNVNECLTDNGGCSHHCVDDPIGHHCSCDKGYHLVNNRTCEDIDECRDPGACSQICINNVGSYKCECQEGYVKHPNDPTFCKAMHGPGSLIFSKRLDIERLSLDHHQLTKIVDDSKGAAAMDYAFKTGTVFWIETANHTIFKAPIDAGFAKSIVISSNVNDSDGLAVDWIYDHIYWTDTGKNTIEVADFDGNNRKTLIGSSLDEPRSIAVNPLDGWLFWSDWGSFPRIERAGMDGSHRSIIVSHNIQWPNGITLDLVRNRIYWVDAKLSLMSSANYDGSGRRTVLRSKEYLHLPHSLTIFEDTVYWADWEEQTIYKANKFDGSNVEPVLPGRMVHNPMVVHVFHPYKQPQGINFCLTANDRCSHLCLPAPQINKKSPKISCACPDGMKLEDGLLCVDESKKKIVIPETKNTINIEETIVDIELDPEESSGMITIVFVGVGLFVAAFLCILLYSLYDHYSSKNLGLNMNFENPSYKKPTSSNENFNKIETTRLFTPPVTVSTTDESRVPLSSSPPET